MQSHVAAYNQHGLAGLDDGRGVPPKPLLKESEQATFQQRIEEGPRPEDGVCTLRGLDFQRIPGEEFGQWRSLTTIDHLLHQLGYSCLKPRPRHPQADLARQEEFIRELPQHLEQIAASHPEKRVRLYFQNEARLGQQGTLANLWAKTGSRPTSIRQTAYQYTCVFAVVCPETGVGSGLISSHLNTASVNAFLLEFSLNLANDEHAVMLWDGACFHRGHQLQVPANITAITLPPYSPELNPIENLWHSLKSHHWSNRAYADAGELEAAVIQAWQHSVLNTELMKTVCSDKIYQRKNAVIT